MTEGHISEAKFKAKAINSIEKVIALIYSSKFSKIALTPFARTEQIAHLFTDDNLRPEWAVRLKKASLAFTICNKDTVSTFIPSIKETRHYWIGFANLSEQLSFAADVRLGLERAAEEAGNIDLLLTDNRLDADTALETADRFIEQNLDLIIEYQIDAQANNLIMDHTFVHAVPET